jgi:hypothetical protein
MTAGPVTENEFVNNIGNESNATIINWVSISNENRK